MRKKIEIIFDPEKVSENKEKVFVGLEKLQEKDPDLFPSSAVFALLHDSVYKKERILRIDLPEKKGAELIHVPTRKK